MDDPVPAARAVVAELFPAVRWAVLGGSVLTAARTAGSDLDIVVCLDGEADVPYRLSLRRAWPVELFVHDADSLDRYLAKDVARRQPSLHRMLADGTVVAGDAGEATRVRDRCAAALAAGPDPLGDAEWLRLRYAVTDLLDDLAHSRDGGETVVVAATLWTSAATLALHAGGHWVGSGKWLLRELRAYDPALADRWLAAHGDPVAVGAFATEALDRVGGPLFDGYRAGGERPGTA